MGSLKKELQADKKLKPESLTGLSIQAECRNRSQAGNISNISNEDQKWDELRDIRQKMVPMGNIFLGNGKEMTFKEQ